MVLSRQLRLANSSGKKKKIKKKKEDQYPGQRASYNTTNVFIIQISLTPHWAFSGFGFLVWTMNGPQRTAPSRKEFWQKNKKEREKERKKKKE